MGYLHKAQNYLYTTGILLYILTSIVFDKIKHTADLNQNEAAICLSNTAIYG